MSLLTDKESQNEVELKFNFIEKFFSRTAISLEIKKILEERNKSL